MMVERLCLTDTPVTAFVFYEYAITLGQEIDMFWKRRFTGATALFLLNRYLLVLSSTLVVAAEGVTSVQARRSPFIVTIIGC